MWDFSTPEGRLEHGRRIQAAIESAGYESVRSFAEALGCSRALVYRYIKGTTLPPLDVMQRIARLTNRRLPYFYVEGPDEEDESSSGGEPVAAAPSDSGRLFGRARADARQRADSLMRLGAALAAPPDHARAAATYAEVVELAGALGEPVLGARARLRGGNSLIQLGSFPEAIEQLEGALATFDASREVAGARACRQSLVSALQSTGQFALALEYAGRLVASEDAWTRWAAVLSLAAIYEQMGRIREAWAQLGRAEQEAASAEGGEIGAFARTYVLANRANVAMAWGRYRAAARYARRAAECAREAGLPDQALEADLTYGLSLLRAGEVGSAHVHLDRTLRMAELSADQSRQAAALACLCEWYAAAGRLEEAREAGRTGLDMATRVRSAMPELFSALALSRSCLMSHLLSDAEDLAKRALHAANAVGASLYACWARLVQAEVACLREDPHRALHIAEETVQQAEEAEARHLSAEAHRVLSAAFLADGRRQEAISAARRALAEAQNAGLGFAVLAARAALCRALPPGAEREAELAVAHGEVLEMASQLERHRIRATLLRSPDLMYILTELASGLGVDVDDRTLLKWRDAPPADVLGLIPRDSGAPCAPPGGREPNAD